MFIRQLYHELYKMFARKRTYIGFGEFVLVQMAILLIFQLPRVKDFIQRRMGLINAIDDFEYYYGGLTLALVIIGLTFFLLGGLYLALVAGDIVAKEVEEGTIRMVLSRPISRLRLLLIKWLACSIYTTVLVLFLGVSALLMATAYRGHLGGLFVGEPNVLMFYDTGEGLWRFARAIIWLAMSAQVISTLALMFSCFKMKPAAATILTLSFLFMDMVIHNMPYFAAYKHFCITDHTAMWMRTFYENVPWPSIIVSMLVLAAMNATLWIIGATHFCTRDLKT